MNSIRINLLASTVLAGMAVAGAARADVTIGITNSLSGPAASIGVPYDKGLAAGMLQIPMAGGEKLVVIKLDDASDPSAAARNAKKLIDENKVDVILGSAGAPASLAAAGVAFESKVPMIILANGAMKPGQQDWQVTIPQPTTLMLSAIIEPMKKAGVKTVGYIGFSDAWGDTVYDALMELTKPAGITVVTNERYARPDTSVNGQVLKIVAARPDAVMTGGSGTPGALPHLALAERGYKGLQFSSHASTNRDFLRSSGDSVNGMMIPAGPFVVFDQLPASSPFRKAAEDFKASWIKANGEWTNDAFAAYAYDGWLILADAVTRTAGKAKPGTPEYRTALRDAIYSTKELAGTNAVYNFKPGSPFGSDERARVVVRIEKGGSFKLVP